MLSTRTWLQAVCVAVLLGTAGCASYDDMPQTPQDVARLTHAANMGDGAAAWNLYRYYEYKTHDAAKAADWLQRAAALGNPQAREEADYRAEYQKRGNF